MLPHGEEGDVPRFLKACLNGSRDPSEHPALPVTPASIAADAAAAVASGADALHIHPKDGSGRDTLEPEVVAAVLGAVRAAVPGVAVGLTSGDWAAPGPGERIGLVRGWAALPDFASVNWHEPGSADLALTLLEAGVGVEAGLWNSAAVLAWRGWPHRRSCVRVLLEVTEDLPREEAVAEARRLLAALGPDRDGMPVLLHGEGTSAWPVFEVAAAEGLQARIGLEDVLVLPDGTPARGNADLVAAARTLLARRS
jgi:uncharacterized protein (DUF849 family)